MGFKDRYSQRIFRKVAESIPDYVDEDEVASSQALDDTSSYMVAGVQVRCAHCGGTVFAKHMTDLELGEGAYPLSCRALECAGCGHVELFSGRVVIEEAEQRGQAGQGVSHE